MRCSSLRFSRITAEEVDFTGQDEKSSGDENVTPNRCGFASDIQYVGFKTSATRPMCLASKDNDSFTQNFTVTVNGQSIRSRQQSAFSVGAKSLEARAISTNEGITTKPISN